MNVLIILLLLLLIMLLCIIIFLRTPVFGKLPSGERLERMKRSTNFSKGAFQNLSPTPQLAEGYSYSKILWAAIFKRPKTIKPSTFLPTIRTHIKNLNPQEDKLIWFGHSSYYFTIEGKRFLVDPVFSENASPIYSSNRAFKHAYTYTAEDFPEIDFLIITHDHFDHLDYKSIIALRPKIKHIICGLGVGAHFEHWKFDTNRITELDWYESINLENFIQLTATPARHFSGRSYKRNPTLFCSYVIISPSIKLFLGGDSGYDSHFKEISERFGPFDWAILENGQYNPAWKYIHTLPDELPLVIQDLQAKNVLPVHSGKYALALHDWKEPMDLAFKIQSNDFQLYFPKIGEVIHLQHPQPLNANWWDGIE